MVALRVHSRVTSIIGILVLGFDQLKKKYIFLFVWSLIRPFWFDILVSNSVSNRWRN